MRVAGLMLLLLFSTVVCAQSDTRVSFEKLKSLSGEWQGTVRTIPPQADIEGKPMQVTHDFHGQCTGPRSHWSRQA
jgi:hypothetical protein